MQGVEGLEGAGIAVGADRSVDPAGRPRAGWRAWTPGDGWPAVAATERMAGAVLVVAAMAAGLYLALRPGPTVLDTWAPNPLAGSRSGWLTAITSLRYPAVVLAGAVLAAAAVFRRDRARALACLVSPPLALVLCELAFKPLVGRTLGGALSFPSGSTVGAAALATVAVLATPARWRTVTVVVASAYALWMAVAVVSLGWHYPTDALAGLAFGCGLVLLIDGLVAMVPLASGRVTARTPRATATLSATPETDTGPSA